jgi:Uma2 family endonuclease
MGRPGAYNGDMATLDVLDLAAEVDDLLLPPSADGRVRFSREAYHRMVEVGILRSDSRVELIDGEILMMSPIGPPQGGLITRLCDFFVGRVGILFQCRVQLPIVAGDHSEPEPDFAIVHRREHDYLTLHPSPKDVVLLVEVAQSSLDFDLGLKLRLYASSDIREYWVVDVEHRAVLVHRDPAGIQYQTVSRIDVDQHIAPLAAPDCQLDVAWLFH